MDIIVIPFLSVLKTIISFAAGIVIVDVLFGWLVAANAFNCPNKFLMIFMDSVGRLSAFMLNHLRAKTPFRLDVGTIDLSPLFLLLILTFVGDIVSRLMMKIS
ncbi:MAG: YggT family protein [Holosporaceae bacterium]|jgi:uncharacterized protein YggT (Ycf19 family)|nr:YggT family protein [Holosporaceae bacterium]